MNLKDKIIHSGHSYQYSSKEFSTLIKNTGAKISMSRVDNSLDNCEAEYFFFNIKSECLSHIQSNKMTIKEVKSEVTEYIKWYNYNRIQSKWNWKAASSDRVYCVHFNLPRLFRRLF